MDLAIKEQRSRNKIHPKKFALYASCASIVMLFASLSSGFIVRQAQGNWVEFNIPSMFYWSTACIIGSSLTIYLSYSFFKKNATSLYRLFLVATLFLAVGFCVSQYYGWIEIKEIIGLPLGANPSADFVYVLTMLHVAHVFGGMIVLLTALFHAFFLEHRVTETRLLRFELSMIYWHFVDFVWIYLLLFFIYNQS